MTSASISAERSAAAVSLVNNGLPVPAAKMTMRPFEMADGLEPDVRLGDLVDRERSLHPRFEPGGLELRAQRERVDDHREHAHVVRRRAVDPVLRGIRAAQPVATAEDDADLHAEGVDLADLLGEVGGVLRRDAELPVPEERLTGELQEDPVVFRGRGHAASPSWKRAIRLILMFSPVEDASCVTRSPIVFDWSLM